MSKKSCSKFSLNSLVQRSQRRRKATHSKRNRIAWQLQPLEARLLLAADAGEVLGVTEAPQNASPALVSTLDVSSPQINSTLVNRSVDQVFGEAREIAFVDSDVEVDDQLATLVRRGVDLISIDRGTDPLQQIDTVLQERRDITAIHIVSHGDSGQLLLGGQIVDSERLQANSAKLVRWREALTTEADILIYGCDAASDLEGQQFLEKWADLTGADVAGSTNRTGGDLGDWVLESSVGNIESTLFASAADLRASEIVLPLFNYSNFNSIAGLDLNGDTASVANTLQLTGNTTGQRGSAFYDQAISLDNDGSFQTEFGFRILGGTNGADGLTFTIQDSASGSGALGSGGSGLGYNGITNAIAVEFDTYNYNNTEFSDNHVAIVTDVFGTELAVADPPFDLNRGGSDYRAWVDYDGTTDLMSVYISDGAVKPGSALIQATVDLETVVGDQAFVGFTSANGGSSSRHRVTDWVFSDNAGSSSNPGTLAFSSSTATIDEDAGTVSVNVVRTGGSDGAVSVDYATADGSAVAGDDYTSTTDTLTFLNGETSKTITIPIVDDSNVESNETFSIDLSNVAGGATLGVVSSTTITINDDDSSSANFPNYPDFASVAGLNLNGDAAKVANTIQLTGASTGQIGSVFYDQAISLANDGSFQTEFGFRMLGGTNGTDGFTFAIQDSAAGADAIGAGGSGLGFNGLTNAIAVEFDTYNFNNSEFSNNHVAIVTTTSGAELAVADPSFDLNLGGSSYRAWVDYNGTTDLMSVYVSAGPTKPGIALIQTTVDLESVVGSQAYVGFTSGNGGSAARHRITDWVFTDDVPTQGSGPGTLALASGTASVDEDAGTVTMDVIRTGGSTGTVTVDFATADNSAVAGSDYTSTSNTLTFLNGETAKTISVPILDDTTVESSETFMINLSNVSGGANLGSTVSTTVTINDNDTTSTLLDYPSFNSIAGLNLNGDASKVGTELELTSNTTGQIGSAFYDQQISLDNDGSFKTEFGFKMLGGTAGTDGLTFTIQDSPAGADALGTGGSGLGFDGIANSIAVEFDTYSYQNGEFSDNHVAIVTTAFGPELAVANPSFDLNLGGSSYRAWVEYNGMTDLLSVYVSDGATKPTTALIEATVDLESVVGSQAYVGFTAANGGSSARHRILDWTMTDEVPTEGSSPGLFALATTNVIVNEDAGTATIEVLRTAGSSGTVSVDYQTQDNTATNGSDYTGGTQTLTYLHGETTKTVTIPILDDANAESNESFNITILNTTGGASLLVPRTATFTIIDDDNSLPNFADFASTTGMTLNGNASQVANSIQLTPNANWQAGSAFFNDTVPLANDGSFRSAFSFSMLSNVNGADGMTFVIQDDPNGASAIGSNGSSLGFNGIANGVAIEFDTYNSGEINDNHIAIASGTLSNDIVVGESPFDLNDGSTYYAWVDYNGLSDSLSVYISDSATKPDYPLIKATLDLTTLVGDDVYFGFTAATGGAGNAHRVSSWTLDQQVPAADPPLGPSGSVTANNIVTNIFQPTSIDWLPDGTMLIGQKEGIIRTATNGVLNPTPFINISAITNNINDRGLIDIAVHPDFVNNPYVYLAYTYDPPEVNNYAGGTLEGPDGAGNRAARLIRVTANIATNYRTAIPNSEVILLGTNSTWNNYNGFVDSTVDQNEPPAGELQGGGYLQDFINSDSVSHTIGGLAFANDGSLFVSTGDGAAFNRVDIRADRVQDIDSLSGKILRIDPITGDGFSDNPFYNGNPDANRSKVYQLGLRNPFRLAVDDVTGKLYIGEVGWTKWEEINSGPAGANFGWPFYEGASGTSAVLTAYANTPEGQAFFQNPPTVTPSLFALNHQADGINAIVMGDVYNGTVYGSQYEGDVFFNDLGQGIVRHASLDSAGNITDVNVFTTGANVVVMITEGPDGHLYYVNLFSNLIGRWEVV